MGSDMNIMIARDYCLAPERTGCIYPVNFRDKTNKVIGKKRWSYSGVISGFYEINSINGVFQHETKAEISTICV